MAVEEKKEVQPQPQAGETKDDGGRFEPGKMEAWAEEMKLWDFPKPESPPKKEEKPPAPQAKQPETEKKPPYKVLKVDGKEVPVDSEEKLIELAQKGVDYTQKRQRDADWEKELAEREASLLRLEKPLSILAGRIEQGKTLPGEEDGGEPPFGAEDEISDPAAQAKITALESEIQKLRGPVSEMERVNAIRRIEETGVALRSAFDEARKTHPFDAVEKEGMDIPLTDLMIGGYVGALHNRERIYAKTKPGYQPRPINALVAQAVEDFSFLQGKLRESSGAPQDLTIEAFQKAYPDMAKQIAEEAVRAFTNDRAQRPPIVKPSEGAARMPGPEPVKPGASLAETLEAAKNDPEIEAAFDEFAKGGRDIRQYGLR